MDSFAPLLVAPPPPRPPAEPAPHEAALRRALDAARGVSLDPGEAEVWRFHVLSAEAARTVAWLLARRIEETTGLEPAMAALDQMRSVPGWVVVAARRDADAEREAHYRERTLTAVQRASLQLWSEGIRTGWSTEMALEDPAFYEAARMDMDTEVVLGVLWFGHAEKR